VAVRALCEDGHDGAKYLLTGPESLTQRDQVRIIGAAIGRAIRFEEIPPEVARREMAITMSPSIADMLLNAWPATLGRPARSFHDWVVDHAGEFQRLPY
jgi:uncharacterized protein YbjT (DUF2867 family)